MWEVPGCGSTRGKNRWKLLSFFGGIFRDADTFARYLGSMLVYFVFQLESQSSKRWKVCQKFLDFFEHLIQSSLFPEMLESWYFFGGVERLFLRFVK